MILTKNKTRNTNKRGYYCKCVCDCCNKKFIRKASMVDRSKQHFCGLECSRNWQKGKNNHNWKGGKSRHSKGYIMIKNPKHPYSDKAGYIMEHRIVMEKYLGRYLKPEETVHHLHGTKHDNRIENLELWSGSHPAGQKVNDKINWAKGFLEQYGYDIKKS